jgi:predicted outer membrane protein
MLSASELAGLEYDPPSVLERSRPLVRILFVLVAVLALLASVSPASLAQTASVSDTDAVLLTKVRQAGLWEMPSGMMAMQKGSPKVQAVGFAIMMDHGRLDVATRALSQKLNSPVPDQPSEEQRGWLAEEMAAPPGPSFDRVFANRLRAAHGQVFAVLAQLRAGTRNDDVRAFATVGNQAVLRHMTMLESTGMVDYTALPTPSVSTTAAPTGIALGLDSSQIAVVAALFLLVGGGLFYVLRQIKGNRGRGRATSRPAAVRTGGSRG